MKSRTLSIIVFLILILKSGLVSGQLEIGAYGGASSFHISGDRPSNSVYTPGPGWTAGAIFNIPLAKDVQISLKPGLTSAYANIRTADTIEFLIFKKLEYRDSVSLKMNFTTLPVLIKVLSDNQRFYFTSGLEFIYLYNITADNGDEIINIPNQVKDFNMSVRFGMGYVIPLKRSALSINLNYSQSINNWSDNEEEDSYVPRIKTSGMRLALGWTIPVSKKKGDRQ